VSFAAHCECLGTPLKNKRWSWAALSADGKRAVFTIWSEALKRVAETTLSSGDEISCA
jgi:hypothetical protein